MNRQTRLFSRWRWFRLPILLAGALLTSACQQEEAPSKGAVVVSSPKPAKKAEPPPPDPSLWETPLSDPGLEEGRVVWTGTCISCHSTGLGGAPLIGNRDLWGPRIEQGLETLVDHATKGFYGDVGEMPARGGNADLSDEQIRAAVRFMASRADPSVLE